MKLKCAAISASHELNRMRWRASGKRLGILYAFQMKDNSGRDTPLPRPALHNKTKSLAEKARLNFCSKLFYTLNDDPQPQVLFTLGFSNLKPAPSSVST